MTQFPWRGDNFRALGNLTPEQTLAALTRVSKGEVWNVTPPIEGWQPVRDPIAAVIHKILNREAAE